MNFNPHPFLLPQSAHSHQTEMSQKQSRPQNHSPVLAKSRFGASADANELPGLVMFQTNRRMSPSSRRRARGAAQAQYLAFPVPIKREEEGEAQRSQSHENGAGGWWMNVVPTGGKSKLLPAGVTMTPRDPRQPSPVCVTPLM